MSRLVVAIVAVIIVLAALAAASVTLFHPASAASYTPAAASYLPDRELLAPIGDNVPNAQQLRLGQYLVRMGDCQSCHTAPGGQFLSGGFGLNTPFGIIYSTNITPDPDTGIGNWTPEAFYAALHDGTGRGGHKLYPAMPYTYMTRVTRADSDAMLAFLKSIPPVKATPPANGLPFPFNVRSMMLGWNLLFFHPGQFQPQAGKSEEWNRGAYLVTGLGHCGACHTPKNRLGADEAGKPLHGGTLDNWTAPDLTANARTGLGNWTVDDIAEYLKNGRNAHANAGGAMAEAVTYSTSLLSDADRHAIAVYLKDQPASPDRDIAAADAAAMQRGEAIFSDACTACHMEGAKGQQRLFPPLGGSAVAQQEDSTGLLHIILAGDRTATTPTAPTPLAMPSFAWKLDDQQVADVATYVRNSWGNRAAPITPKQVADTRTALKLGDTGQH